MKILPSSVFSEHIGKHALGEYTAVFQNHLWWHFFSTAERTKDIIMPVLKTLTFKSWQKQC